MATLEVFFFLTSFFFSFYLPNMATSTKICSPSKCSTAGPEIRFPFYLKDRQPYRRSFSGFHLSCNNRSQTIINLPFAGEFAVRSIDYFAHQISINDPDNCLAKRRSLDMRKLQGTTFAAAGILRNYTLFNCSFMPGIPPPWSISCPSPDSNMVIAEASEHDHIHSISSCRIIGTALVPWADIYAPAFRGDITLNWSVPACQPCENRGAVCGFKGDASMEIGCSDEFPPPSMGPNYGFTTSAKYGIMIGLPIIVFIIGLAYFVCGRVRTYGHHHRPNTEFSISIVPQSAVVITGLDGPIIESYPKTVLGESGRLPKPNDGTCPICLSEYQPKDTLRTIPDCNHYFHADCIDEWLKMNATCPLCRNSPDRWSVITPCSSSSSSLSSSSSSP